MRDAQGHDGHRPGQGAAGALSSRPLLAMAFAFLLIFGIGLHFFDTNNDLWWHLKTGELIVKEMHIPSQDSYSFTREGHPWVALEWLSEIVLYGVASLLGFGALVWFKAFVFVLVMSLLWSLIREKEYPYLWLTLTVIAALLVQFHLLLRPHLFFWLFLLLTLFILRKRKTPLLLIPLFIIWANAHASVMIGLFVAGSYALEAWWRSRSFKAVYPFLPLPFAALLNPVSYRVFLTPFHIISESKEFIAEWQPFPLGDPHLIVFVLLLVLLLFLVFRTRGIRIADLLPLLVMVPLAFNARRNLPVAVFFLIIAIADRLRRLMAGPGMPSRRIFRVWSERSSAALPLFLVLILFIGAVMVHAGTAFSPSFPRRQYALNAMDFILNHDIGPDLFNDYAHGGVAIFKGYPRTKVFIDGRIDMYGEDMMKRYLIISEQLDGWEDLLAPYAIDGFLLSHGSPLERHLLGNRSFKLVYFDELVSVFVPVRPDTEHLRGFSLLGPRAIKAPSSPEEASALAEEMSYLLSLDPGNAEMHKNLGMLLVLSGMDVEKGKAELSQYLFLAPRGPFAQEVRALLVRS
ncbi:MAG: hypothetical protein GXP63_07425 [DPANN group archaeon]|nr:hypothetical protein [DPANN group archaeon]